MSSSISFDRAAGYYDKTRALPAQQADLLTDAIVNELDGRDRTLEIGVGTGRIALPLQACGIDLTGIDISLPMLERLQANAGGRAPFPVLAADATRLPFDDRCFDAVIASHVFHLIPAWREAADEALRVLAPGGTLLADFGWHGGWPLHDEVAEIMRREGVERVPAGTTDPEELASYVAGRAAMRGMLDVTIPVQTSLAQYLEGLERQVMSWTWSFSPEDMRRASGAVRAWAADTGVDLTADFDVPYGLRWWAYDLVAD